MKVLKLQAVHRILLNGILDESLKDASHSLVQLDKLMKLASKIWFTEEEVKTLDLRPEKIGENNFAWRWNTKAEGKEDGADVDFEREIELSDAQGELLMDIFKKKNEAKTFTKDHVALIGIAGQLGVELGE